MKLHHWYQHSQADNIRKHFFLGSISPQRDQPNECYQHLKTSLLCLTISLWLQMKSPFCVSLTEPRPYFTQGTTLLNLRYNGPPHVLDDGVQRRISLLWQQFPAWLDTSKLVLGVCTHHILQVWYKRKEVTYWHVLCMCETCHPEQWTLTSRQLFGMRPL